jgi:GrpB-like predicted nucleotidyltransferase (UPF0157 family)
MKSNPARPSRDAPVEIVAYDPWWPARFEVERDLLIEATQALARRAC